MTIELKKETKLDGRILFCTYINNAYDNCFIVSETKPVEKAQKEAEEYVALLKKNANGGVLKTEIILTETF